MRKVRLLFAKESPASYLSHLDVMRTFSRSFNRAGIPLRHTEGFNPHPYLSIAHPLPVGVTGSRELLDCVILPDDISDLASRLNDFLPAGLRIAGEADPGRDLNDIAFAHYTLELFYDSINPADIISDLTLFFAGPDIPVTKKSKKGMVKVNLAENIARADFEPFEDGISLSVLIKADPAPLSPKYLADAVGGQNFKPDFVRYHRNGFLDADKMPFARVDSFD
jgi:radical SAM-linked protein